MTRHGKARQGKDIMSETKPHISPSQLGMFARCGEAYRRRYIDGERIPPGMAATRGIGVHAGIEANFKQKIESHEDLPASDIVDAAVAGMDQRINADGYVLTPEEESIGEANVLGKTRDKVAQLARFHAEEQAPDYQPTHSETGVRIELPNATHDLFGYVDVIDDSNVVSDFKTAGKKKSQSEADTNLALTFYSAAANILTGEPSPTVRLDVIVDYKRGPARQIVSSTRGANDYRVLGERANVILRAIETGIFTPADPASWMCSTKWCGYARTCPYFNSER